MKQSVLDHGYVDFVEAWGRGKADRARDGNAAATDMEPAIIEAARMSTQGSFRGWEEDQKLLSFLFNSKPPHAGPFEFAGMTIEVQAPIFVFREWHRHRTQSYNEMSARYAPLPCLDYVPTVERILAGGSHITTNKQAQPAPGAMALTETTAGWFQRDLRKHYESAEEIYQLALSTGVPKELARVCLPVGRYSRMRASANLRNWLAFMTLRFDPGAQWEIQQYAALVGNIINETFPRVWKLYLAAKDARTIDDETRRKAALWDALQQANDAAQK